MMSGSMPPTAGGMGVMGVMGGYLGGVGVGREYLEGGSVGVDPSVWVPPFWEDPHLSDGHLHDPNIPEAAHMGEPPTMGEVGPTDLMDAFPPQSQHGESVKRYNPVPCPSWLLELPGCETSNLFGNLSVLHSVLFCLWRP